MKSEQVLYTCDIKDSHKKTNRDIRKVEISVFLTLSVKLFTFYVLFTHVKNYWGKDASKAGWSIFQF